MSVRTPVEVDEEVLLEVEVEVEVDVGTERDDEVEEESWRAACRVSLLRCAMLCALHLDYSVPLLYTSMQAGPLLSAAMRPKSTSLPVELCFSILPSAPVLCSACGHVPFCALAPLSLCSTEKPARALLNPSAR